MAAIQRTKENDSLRYQMTESKRLLCVFAHPDDETLGAGSTLATYAAAGVELYLVTATRGERGWQDEPSRNPGPQALGEIRTAELLAEAQVLGIREVQFLNYLDGDLDQADPAEAIGRIVAHIRRIRPQVVVTFGPEGSYGHPDHIAISQFTSAAVVCAADATYSETLPPHRVAKLYYMVDSRSEVAALVPIIGDIQFMVDGVQRGIVAWEEWAVTSKIDGRAHWQTAQRAAACHASQLIGYPDFTSLPEEVQAPLWGLRSYYRAFSLVNGGRRVEHDLFEGV
jgi:LmbE family N-acetylglucosaminyl deacetylase